MTVLRFDGELVISYFTVKIGGIDVIEAIRSSDLDKDKVTLAYFVGEARKVFLSGDIWAYEGYPGYSEWTPGESCGLEVGNRDIVSELESYEYDNITMIISDEPVDFGEYCGR